MNKSSTEEIQYRLLRILESDPFIMQRAMAARMGVCVGRANYCVNELAAKGWVQKIKGDKRKKAYLYQITPAGLEAKARLMIRFLKVKLAEYDESQAQIKALYHEALKHDLGDDRAELAAAVKRMG